jgi:(p)ppGpp synthase/HD superfamily hydrolase
LASLARFALWGISFPERARAFATTQHRGQAGKRPGETYIAHVEKVAPLLQDHHDLRPQVLAAAYLHDCLEKTDTTIADLIRAFGEEVTKLVYWLTEGEEKQLLSRGFCHWRHGTPNSSSSHNADAIRAHDPGRWPGLLQR